MFQQITIVGNLGNDPEMRYAPSGDAVTSFSLAVSRKWKDNSGEAKEKTVWFRISVWGNQAEPC
jgi:single-strand DNA-binding protein